MKTPQDIEKQLAQDEMRDALREIRRNIHKAKQGSMTYMEVIQKNAALRATVNYLKRIIGKDISYE